MSGDPYIKENERLEAEVRILRLNYKEMCDCAGTWEIEAERLRADIERLKAALEEMSTYPVAGDAMVMLDIARKALAKEWK